MPKSLLGMFAGYAVIPLWSLSFFRPFHAEDWRIHALSTLVAILAFWVLPLINCLLIVRRTFLLLPAYLLSSVLLVAQTLLSASLVPWLDWVRLALLGLMFALGMLLMSREMIFPLLKPARRGWRTSPRLYVNMRAVITSPEAPEGIPSVIENCSLTGMLLSGDAERLTSTLREMTAGQRLGVKVRIGHKVEPIEVELVWYDVVGTTTRIGVRACTTAPMRALIDSLGRRPRGGGQVRWLSRFGASRKAEAAIIMAWGLTLSLSMGIPACGTIAGKEERSIAKGGSTAASATNFYANDMQQSDAPAVPIQVDVEWSDEDGGESGLGLSDLAVSFTYQLASCKSGDQSTRAWTNAAAALPTAIQSDVGCIFVVQSIGLGATGGTVDTYTPAPPGQIASQAGGVTVYLDSAGNSLIVTMVSQLASPIAAPESVALRISSLAHGAAPNVNVPLPDYACSLTLSSAGNGGTIATVLIHPVYLPHIGGSKSGDSLTVTVYPDGICDPNAHSCTTKSKTQSPPFAYSNAVSIPSAKTQPGVTQAVGQLTLTDPTILQLVNSQNKSLTCGPPATL